MATWPATLPQSLLATLVRKRQSGKLRSPMDAGPAKQRARFTATTKMYDGSDIFTGAQLAIFNTFYETELGHGAISFTWKDPVTDAVATLRFGDGEPEETLLKAHDDPAQRLYRISLPLEQLP